MNKQENAGLISNLEQKNNCCSTVDIKLQYFPKIDFAKCISGQFQGRNYCYSFVNIISECYRFVKYQIHCWLYVNLLLLQILSAKEVKLLISCELRCGKQSSHNPNSFSYYLMVLSREHSIFVSAVRININFPFLQPPNWGNAFQISQDTPDINIRTRANTLAWQLCQTPRNKSD